MKKCFKCKRTKPLSQFYKHPRMKDGHLNKCKCCTKKDVADNYIKNREKYREYERKRSKDPKRKAAVKKYAKKRKELFPGKVKANQWVSMAVRLGWIVRQPCEVCGDPKSQAHHDDYRKYKTVRWLCFKHHREVHGQTVA